MFTPKPEPIGTSIWPFFVFKLQESQLMELALLKPLNL
jgi:hypothetical protein